MPTYQDLARAVARDVAAGTLAPGTALEPLRSFARTHHASQATALRAYRELAEAEVIETSERRVGHVAAAGAVAAARYLRTSAPFRLAASDDGMLAELVREVHPAIEWVGDHGSGSVLSAIADGRADGAAVHLWHVAGAYNEPYARGLIAEPVVMHLWRREQGLLLAPGNPRRVGAVRDLAGLRVARRPIGTGARSLLDRMTAAAGIVLDASDPEVTRGLDVAVAVASGSVDAGVGTRHAAESLGLAFVPVAVEPLEIVTSAASLPALEPLRRLLVSEPVRARIGRRAGYDPAGSGTTHELTR